LAFGQQERITGFEPYEPHGVDDAPYARLDLRAAATELARPERDLLFHGCREDLIVGILEDVAYGCRACTGTERREWSAAPFDPSLPALQDATEQPRERTLSGAVRADQRHHLALAHHEVDAGERGPRLVFVTIPHTPRFEHCGSLAAWGGWGGAL